MCICVCVCIYRKHPASTEEWARLLEQQQYLHDAEIDRWKDVLGAAVTVMDQVCIVQYL